MKYTLIRCFIELQDAFFKILAKQKNLHAILFTPYAEHYRWYIGQWRVLRTYNVALKRVPAYAAFIRHAGVNSKVEIQGWRPKLELIPEMDKQSYIKKYRIEDRSLDGRLPRKGVIVDESSGSSGQPTSWVRGEDERKATRSLLQVAFARGVGKKPVFVLNAFSLGAWATGMNVSMSLIDLCIMKSTGPDLEKIIHTMQEFGNTYSYFILGYPPFLKDLADDPRIKLSDYDVAAGFGGEGMSENMREYLLRHFKTVYGSYGASDLEINIAVETPFAVNLRQAIEKDPKLAQKLTRTEYGVLPMIFQYNSFDYVIESNKAGELLISIARKENINPRIRYNIHDRGHVKRIKEVRKALRELGYRDLLKQSKLDLPVLFHYGRSDLSIDFYGAVVPPDSIREVLYGIDTVSGAFANYRLISYENAKTDKLLLIAVELKQGHNPADYVADGKTILNRERSKNRDFDNACKIAKPDILPRVVFYRKGTGPFTQDRHKLKNEYVWHLTYNEAKAYGIMETQQ